MTDKAGDNILLHSIWDPGPRTRTQDQDQMSTEEQEQEQDMGSGVGPEHSAPLWAKTQDQKLHQKRVGLMARDRTRIDWTGTQDQAPETEYRIRT